MYLLPTIIIFIILYVLKSNSIISQISDIHFDSYNFKREYIYFFKIL